MIRLLEITCIAGKEAHVKWIIGNNSHVRLQPFLINWSVITRRSNYMGQRPRHS